MRLQRLRLMRMPGLEDGFELRDLTDGLNVIVGPNGSGKSSMCRAVRAMLWGAPAGMRVECEGTWLDGQGRRLESELDGRRTTWREGGRAVKEPRLPDGSLSGCYVIGVEDLVALEGESDLAGRVLREMMAGVDPGAVRRAAFAPSARAGQTERRALEQARRALHEAEAEAARLDDALARLPELERQRDEARQARLRLVRLERRRELAEVEARVEAARARLAALPAHAERVRGDEVERLRGLRAQWMEGEQRKGRLAAELSEARRVAEAGAASFGVVEAVELEACRGRVSELSRLLLERERVQRGVSPLEARRVRLEARVGPCGAALDGAAALSLVEDLETVMRAREGQAREVEALESEARALSAMAPARGGEGVALLEARLTALRRWAWAMEGEGDTWRAGLVARLRLLVWALVTALLVCGVAMAWWSLVAGVVVMLAAVAGGVMVWMTGRWGVRLRDGARAEARAAVEAAGLPVTEMNVSVTAREVEEALASARLVEARREVAARVQQRLGEARRRLGETECRLEALCAEVGADAGVVGSAGVFALASDVAELRRVSDEHAAALSELEALDEEIATLREMIMATLRSCGVEAMETCDVAALEARVHEVVEQRRVWVRAGEQVAALETRLGEVEAEQQGRRREAGEVYALVGVADGEQDEVRRLVEAAPAYRAAKRELEGAEAAAAQLRQGLDDEGAEGDGMSAAEIDVAIAEARRASASWEDVVEEITSIEKESERALRACAVAAALGEVERAERALAAVRDETLMLTAGAFLLERAERAHRREQEPEVLTEASRLLSLFTRGRYELVGPRPDDETGAAFVVRDVVTDRFHELAQLSTGTRAQLLLAVRLAFATRGEEGMRMPLFLDEALSSSDPDRFDAVVRALAVVAREGRQVFYMTCQDHDWHRIRETLSREDGGGRERSPLRLIELAAVRREAAAASSWTRVSDVSALSARDLKLDAVPAYCGQDGATYARELGVAAFDPSRAPSAAHIFHVLEDDPARVASLLEQGVMALGQLKRAPVEHWVLARIALVEAFCEAWRIGRGRRVDREALRRGGVSERFEAEVWDLAREVGHDAAALLEALKGRRVKGMQARTIEGLADSLEAEGYLDGRRVLEVAALRARVGERMGRFVTTGAMEEGELTRRLDGLMAASGMPLGVSSSEAS